MREIDLNSNQPTIIQEDKKTKQHIDEIISKIPNNEKERIFVYMRDPNNFFFILGKDNYEVDETIIPSCKLLNTILNNEMIIFSNNIGKFKKINLDNLESYIREENNKNIIYVDYSNIFMDSSVETDIESDFEIEDNNSKNIDKNMKEIRIIDLFLNSLCIDNDIQNNSLGELFSIVIILDIDLFNKMFNLSLRNIINIIKFNNIIFIGVDNKNLSEVNKYLLYFLFFKLHNKKGDILLSNENTDWIYDKLDMKFNGHVINKNYFNKYELKNVRDLVSYLKKAYDGYKISINRDNIKYEIMNHEIENTNTDNLLFLENFYKSINININ